MKLLPRYPIFIPSKGRADKVLTAGVFERDAVPYHLVVEPQEAEAYAKVWGQHRVLVLPENNRGLVFSRNWIKLHSIAQGDARHWQFDDDIRAIGRLHKGFRMLCEAGLALAACEDFVDQYENVALASLNDHKFLLASHGIQREPYPPFYLNARCYTCFLVLNAIPYDWRYRYNEDTDMTLQALSGGWCTMLFNAFNMVSPATLTRPGGQMVSQTANYNADGRLEMARQLERVWPGAVTTKRRFHRAQHTIKNNWKGFDTPLKKKANPPPLRDYRMTLEQLKEIKNDKLQALFEEVNRVKE